MKGFPSSYLKSDFGVQLGLENSRISQVGVCSLAPGAIDANRNYVSDYVTSPLLEWALHVFKPDSMKATDPYLSPLNNEFSTTVPVFKHRNCRGIV
jgi:hypothetical protein